MGSLDDRYCHTGSGMIGDIVAKVPEFCSGCDTWHLNHYWVYEDGSCSVCDSGGNHDDMDADDIPDYEQERRAWREYYTDVARTGQDPIGDFSPPANGTVPRRWQARVRNWIGARSHGLKVSGVRRRGKGPWIDARKAPASVAEYLGLTDRTCLDGFHSLNQLKCEAEPKDIVNIRKGGEAWVNFTVDEPLPKWTEKRVSAWLKRRAKEALMEPIWNPEVPTIDNDAL